MTITTTVHIEGDKMNVRHNQRKGKLTKNIDPDRPHLTVRDTPILDAYEELFGDAIREYNAKQKRKDRKIDGVKGYFHKIELDPRQHNGYEAVLDLGNKNNHLSYEDSKEIFLNFLDEFEKKFPNFKVIGFYIHGDEQGAIHAHIDFIPVAHQCKRGISTGVSMSGALTEMGIVPDKDKNPSAIYTDMMRDILDDCTRKQGHEVQEHVHKDKVDRRNWMSTEAYAKMKDNARLNNERVKIEAGIEKNNGILKNQIETYNHNKQVINGQVDTYNKNKDKIKELEDKIEEKEQDIKTLDADIKTKSDKIKKADDELKDLIKQIKPIQILIDFFREMKEWFKKEKDLKDQLKRLNDAGFNQLWNTETGQNMPLSDILNKVDDLDQLTQAVNDAIETAEDIKNGVYDDLEGDDYDD